jgi:DNA-binding CsgD family transcriptional regulator
LVRRYLICRFEKSLIGKAERFWVRHASCITHEMRASKPAKRQWTSGEENKLRDLLAGGKTADEIAVALGRTRNAVYARLQRIYRMRPRGLSQP